MGQKLVLVRGNIHVISRCSNWVNTLSWGNMCCFCPVPNQVNLWAANMIVCMFVDLLSPDQRLPSSLV